MIDWLPNYINYTDLIDHRQFLQEAYIWAKNNSDDIHTQVGAVIVSNGKIISEGANRIPIGVKKCPSRLERPTKYSYIEHAERDAIYKYNLTNTFYNAGNILYAPWFACADCARAIIYSGITKVVGHRLPYTLTPQRWHQSILDGLEMMHEAKINMFLYTKPIDLSGNLQIKFNETMISV